MQKTGGCIVTGFQAQSIGKGEKQSWNFFLIKP